MGLGLTAGAQAPDNLSVILVYKGETAGTGPGIASLKLKVNEEAILTCKGMSEDGKEVLIAPTWKADKEVVLTPVEGKGRSIKAKLVKAPSGVAFITVTVITDGGKKVVKEIPVEVSK
ncbi:MAG: hypothetical protein N2712_06490 [Brevinematales bacterium]|nr:hypothetical protein [Brevinematales bacterium]